ncbi:MAG TPA: hypothetical protein VHK90_17800 [Thermoanaerobaculia bacterium]|nr:hypothetical protein [Thermoanaerobaculia bacterium]
MPTWLKVILVILAIGCVLVAVGVVVAARYIKQNAPQWREQGEVVRAEGIAFGRGKEANACVDEAMARLQRCDDLMMCEVRTKLFLSACLGAATRPEGFCSGVPKRDEILASAQWAVRECARRGQANSQRCTRVIAAVQEVCE